MKFLDKKTAVSLATALGFVLGAAQARAEEFVNILTGGTSGVYYPLGVAMEKIYSGIPPDVRPSVQATKASIENINLINSGRGEVAFTLGDSLRDAYEGNEAAGFKTKLTKLSTLAAIYPNYVQIVASKESGIKTLADLKGKRLSVGAPKSGTELNARTILEAAGLSYDDLGKIEYLPFAESVELMKNRQLDATLQSSGLGVASLRDLANSVEINVVEIPSDVIEKIGAPYQVNTIPANTYTGQDKDVVTASVINYLIVRPPDMDEELVYQMTKGLFENLDQLAAAHASAKAIKLDKNTIVSPVPVHPGAMRYFKEKGIE
ncbi:C4-dicarboxylate ABC transporter [Brucella intermedia 229E]|uniref:C4-dicarboxylate ABC transporter n=1 Tax=Brucella intermedia 229E TaxID=1337887 RepID=U4VCZ5_9HYPH|nr:C4-dicarboxylate ABC transporter [Brucella intermedia 229E]